jgi:hypothetical protein
MLTVGLIILLPSCFGACYDLALVMDESESIERSVFQEIISDSHVLDLSIESYVFDGNKETLRALLT